LLNSERERRAFCLVDSDKCGLVVGFVVVVRCGDSTRRRAAFEYSLPSRLLNSERERRACCLFGSDEFA
jgi:hypothetical protein